MRAVDDASAGVRQGFHQGEKHHGSANDYENVLQFGSGGIKAFYEVDAHTENELQDKELESHGQRIAQGIYRVLLQEVGAAEAHQNQRGHHGDHGLTFDENHIGGNQRKTDNDHQGGKKQGYRVAGRPRRELVQYELHKLHAGNERRIR